MSTDVPIGEHASNEIEELTRAVHQELDRYREKGEILRYVGTGSAIAGGAAVVLPLMLSLTTTIPLVGLAGAGYALLRQRARDRNISQWNERLEDISQLTDVKSRTVMLQKILREVEVANA